MDKKEFTESYQNLLEENKNLFNAYLADPVSYTHLLRRGHMTAR